MVAADREGIRWRNRLLVRKLALAAGRRVRRRAHRHRAPADRRPRRPAPGPRPALPRVEEAGRPAAPDPRGPAPLGGLIYRRPSVLPIRSLPFLKLPVSRARACWVSAGLGVGEAVDRLVGGRPAQHRDGPAVVGDLHARAGPAPGEGLVGQRIAHAGILAPGGSRPISPSFHPRRTQRRSTMARGELAALDLGGAVHQPGEVVGDDLVGDGGLEGPRRCRRPRPASRGART